MKHLFATNNNSFLVLVMEKDNPYILCGKFNGKTHRIYFTEEYGFNCNINDDNSLIVNESLELMGIDSYLINLIKVRFNPGKDSYGVRCFKTYERIEIKVRIDENNNIFINDQTIAEKH